MTLPTSSPEWTTLFNGESCGPLSYFKILSLNPVESYNSYILDNMIDIKSSVIILNGESLEIETSNMRYGGKYELSISSTLKDHHATDPVVLAQIGQVPTGVFKAYVEIFDACIYSRMQPNYLGEVEYSILDKPRDLIVPKFKVLY